MNMAHKLQSPLNNHQVHWYGRSLSTAPMPCADLQKRTAKGIVCAPPAAETGSASEGIVREFTDALAKDTDIAVAVAVIKVCSSMPRHLLMRLCLSQVKH